MSKQKQKTIRQIRQDIKTTLNNKYYDLWMSKYDTDLDPQVYHYLFKEWYYKGEIAAFKLKHTNDICVTPFNPQEFNMYDYPERIQLINLRNSPVIPNKIMVVNKDAVVGYCQSNHKSIKFMVDKYIDRIVEVEMVINTQLITHKLPFLVGISPEDELKARDIINKLLADEPVLFVDLQDLTLVKTLVNNNPYIIDKLIEYKQSIECELLTFLGLDNAVSQKVNLDITNANNSLINAFKEDIDSNIQTFVKECSKYLGLNFYLTMKQAEIQSVYEENNPELENNTTKEGIEHYKKVEEDSE